MEEGKQEQKKERTGKRRPKEHLKVPDMTCKEARPGKETKGKEGTEVRSMKGKNKHNRKSRQITERSRLFDTSKGSCLIVHPSLLLLWLVLLFPFDFSCVSFRESHWSLNQQTIPERLASLFFFFPLLVIVQRVYFKDHVNRSIHRTIHVLAASPFSLRLSEFSFSSLFFVFLHFLSRHRLACIFQGSCQSCDSLDHSGSRCW